MFQPASPRHSRLVRRGGRLLDATTTAAAGRSGCGPRRGSSVDPEVLCHNMLHHYVIGGIAICVVNRVSSVGGGTLVLGGDFRFVRVSGCTLRLR